MNVTAGPAERNSVAARKEHGAEVETRSVPLA